MSEHDTELFEKLKRFMTLNPEQRDESLWFEDVRLKGAFKDLSAVARAQEDKINRLIKSNGYLQKAIYVAGGIGVAVKFYFEYIHPTKP